MCWVFLQCVCDAFFQCVWCVSCKWWCVSSKCVWCVSSVYVMCYFSVCAYVLWNPNVWWAFFWPSECLLDRPTFFRQTLSSTSFLLFTFRGGLPLLNLSPLLFRSIIVNGFIASCAVVYIVCSVFTKKAYVLCHTPQRLLSHQLFQPFSSWPSKSSSACALLNWFMS